jgi:hypothetical protein
MSAKPWSVTSLRKRLATGMSALSVPLPSRYLDSAEALEMVSTRSTNPAARSAAAATYETMEEHLIF